jgi:hypothetical protein
MVLVAEQGPMYVVLPHIQMTQTRKKKKMGGTDKRRKCRIKEKKKK